MTIKATIKKLATTIDKVSPAPFLYSFVMSKNEKNLFGKIVKDSKAYLEFGMGGSTIRALKNSKAKIYSIDSSFDWINEMREYLLIRRMENKRLFLFHVDVGPTQIWGYPIENGSKELFPDYSSKIFGLIEKGTLDTILVDGRFRVACTLKSIVECHTNDNLKILIHDFWIRPKYHIVLKYLTEIERADTLGVFRIKDNIDIDAVIDDYEAYKYDFS